MILRGIGAASLGWRLRVLRPLVRRPLVRWRHRNVAVNDVVVAEYPRSGSTWLAFMLGEVTYGREMDFDNQQTLLPAVGRQKGMSGPLPGGGWLLRTHERPRKEYRKSIYIVRNVGDVAVSYYKWLQWLAVDPGDFKSFLRLFLSEPMDSYGPWQRHVREWFDPSGPHPLIIRYEDLRAETHSTLRGILDYIDVPFEEETLNRAVENNSLDGMREKENRARASSLKQRNEEGRFVRKGSVGGWSAWLDEEDVAFVNQMAGEELAMLGYGMLDQHSRVRRELP